jgi:hypothetical protein
LICSTEEKEEQKQDPTKDPGKKSAPPTKAPDLPLEKAQSTPLAFPPPGILKEEKAKVEPILKAPLEEVVEASVRPTPSRKPFRTHLEQPRGK